MVTTQAAFSFLWLSYIIYSHTVHRNELLYILAAVVRSSSSFKEMVEVLETRNPPAAHVVGTCWTEPPHFGSTVLIDQVKLDFSLQHERSRE